MRNIFLKTLISLSVSVFIAVSMNTKTLATAPETALLLDDFERDTLGGEPGGDYGEPNNRGLTIYWMNWNENTKPEIVDGALKVEFTDTANGEGWYGEGAAIKSDEGYKYLVLRMKGEKGGEEEFLSVNPDARMAMFFKDLKEASGEPLKITTEYRDIIIDMQANEFNSKLYTKGLEAVHINASADCTIYIDEIYLMKTADIENEPAWTGMGAKVEAFNPDDLIVPEGTTTADIVTLAPAYTGDVVIPETESITSEVTENDSLLSVPILTFIIVAVVLIIVVIIILLTRKGKKGL